MKDLSALVKQIEQPIDMVHPDAELDKLKEVTAIPGVARVRGEALYAISGHIEADKVLDTSIKIRSRRRHSRKAARPRALPAWVCCGKS